MKACPARTAAVVVAVLAVGFSAHSQEKKKPSPKELTRIVAQGDKLLAEGRLLDARDSYLSVIKEDPANAAVALKVARVSEQVQDWGGAIAAYQIVAANTRGAEQANAYAGLAEVYVRSAKYQEASDSARKAIALNPSIASAHVTLAYSLIRIGSTQEALSAARKALETAPANAVAHATLGEALLSQGNAAEAEGAFRKAIELDPKAGKAYTGLADIAYRNKDFAGAVASATKALEFDPSVSQAYAIRGRANNARGQVMAASWDLELALKVDPDDAESALALAQVQRKQGNRDSAASSYRRALSLNPNLREAYLELGEILVTKGEYPEAREVLEKAILQTPDAAHGHELLGSVYEKQKQVDAAIKAYGRAVEIDPKLAEIHYRRGKLLHEQKNDAASALPSLEKAVELNPDNADFLTGLGLALYDIKQGDRAIAILQKATGTAGYKSAAGFVVLGLALKDKQSFGEALPWFGKASELAPEWWLPHWGAAWSYFGTIKKGCPCGPEDADRVAKMKDHFDKMLSLKGKDAGLQERVDALTKGQKVR